MMSSRLPLASTMYIASLTVK